MKILVTGCAGFIGSHLCERLLQDGYEVSGIDNFDPFYSRAIKLDNINDVSKSPGFQFRECDITNRDALDSLEGPFEIIMHFAAKAGVRPSIENPAAYIQNNISGTQNILDFAVKNKISKIIFASSSSVYGNHKKVPFREDFDISNPISPYAFTKASCELLLHTYFHLYAINSISLRLFTVFGPRQRPDLAIHKFFRSVYNNSPIPVFGDGSSSRDYTYVGDIVDGIAGSLNLLNSSDRICEIINLGNNKPVDLNHLIKMIEKISGRKASIDRKEMQPGDVERTFADISKARELLGYQPATSMEEGLKIFNDWLLKKMHG